MQTLGNGFSRTILSKTELLMKNFYFYFRFISIHRISHCVFYLPVEKYTPVQLSREGLEQLTRKCYTFRIIRCKEPFLVSLLLIHAVKTKLLIQLSIVQLLYKKLSPYKVIRTKFKVLRKHWKTKETMLNERFGFFYNVQF